MEADSPNSLRIRALFALVFDLETQEQKDECSEQNLLVFRSSHYKYFIVYNFYTLALTELTPKNGLLKELGVKIQVLQTSLSLTYSGS